MPRRIRVILVGQALLDVLKKTVAPIKILNRNGSLLMHKGKACLLTSQQAVMMVRFGDFGQYVGESTPQLKRVYCLREIDIDPRPRYLWVPDFDYLKDRAVIRYAPDMRNIPVRCKNKEQADMWDRMLKRNPPPRSWKRRIP